MVSRLLEAAGVSGLVFFAIGFEFSEFDDLGYVQHGEAFFVADPASSAVANRKRLENFLLGHPKSCDFGY